jgi:hypothetical protein
MTKVYTQTITKYKIQPPFKYNHTEYMSKDMSNTLFGIPFNTVVKYKHGVVRFLDDSERIVTFVVRLWR